MTDEPGDCKMSSPGNNRKRRRFAEWPEVEFGVYNEMMNETGVRERSGRPGRFGRMRHGTGVSQPCDGTWMT